MSHQRLHGALDGFGPFFAYLFAGGWVMIARATFRVFIPPPTIMEADEDPLVE